MANIPLKMDSDPRGAADASASYQAAAVCSPRVPPGHELTEVALIPEDWDFGEIGDLNPFVTSGSRGWAQYYSNRGSAFLRIANLSRESIYIDLSDLKLVRLPPNDTEGLRTQLQDGDLLVSITADIGIIGFVDPLVPKPAYINQHIALVRFDATKTDSRFLSYFLASEGPQRAFRATTDQGAKAGMNLTGVRRIRAAFPPLPEQRAIAAALSDVDALLAKLDQLIAKKRDLKRAAMQQLLTAQTRLPGFSGDWEVRRFGELFQFMSTANNPRADLSEHGDVGYIHYGDIHTASSAFLNCGQTGLPLIAKEKVSAIPFVEDGDLVMADASEDYAGIGKGIEVTNVKDRKIVAGLHTFLLRGKKELLADGFKGYLQFIPSVKADLIRFATGISVYGVSKTNVRSIEVRLPRTAEQTAIAAVLSDMDAEIAALEARRDKTRALKQGMMQELLTGRIRLV